MADHVVGNKYHWGKREHKENVKCEKACMSVLCIEVEKFENDNHTI